MTRFTSFMAIALLLVLALPFAGTPGAAAQAGPAGSQPGRDPASALQRFVIAPNESQVVYRVGEVFINQGNRFNVAVGTTNSVRGEIMIDRARPRNSRIGTITVDISQFRSDSGRRDNAIRDRWLESSRFPTAEFTPTSIEGLPEAYTEGRDLNLQVTGNLKVREVTRPTTFAVTLKLQGGVMTGTGTTMIKMTDFGFDPPAIFGILRAENDAKLELRFVARPGQ
jgi:polyisoprenoid-binding protein YceI